MCVGLADDITSLLEMAKRFVEVAQGVIESTAVKEAPSDAGLGPAEAH